MARKKQFYIYWIAAEAIYPVCDAGAVVIATNEKQALFLVPTLYKPKEPMMLGLANGKEPKVIVQNNGDY